MTGKNSANTGSDIVPVQSIAAETRPRGLIEAISNIEYYHAQEKRGAILSAGFFTLKQKIEYFEVGFRGAFVSGLITAMITPLAIAVVERLIPVFGSSSPSTFDKLFVFMLAFGFWLCYASFIARAASLYIGPYTRSMIRNFVGGVVTGAVGKMIIAFIFLHFLGLVLLTETNSIRLLLMFGRHIRTETFIAAYGWIKEFRPVLITASYLIVLTTFVFIALPLITMIFVSNRNKRLERIKAIVENR
ncbi:MAG: hypothetical protein HXX11_12780 [Desulfuromonadales bacterium]|nr:hypothetical protein [Desulfuromonadales bacterium]